MLETITFPDIQNAAHNAMYGIGLVATSALIAAYINSYAHQLLNAQEGSWSSWFVQGVSFCGGGSAAFFLASRVTLLGPFKWEKIIQLLFLQIGGAICCQRLQGAYLYLPLAEGAWMEWEGINSLYFLGALGSAGGVYLSSPGSKSLLRILKTLAS
jgi:hypothetical protein